MFKTRERTTHIILCREEWETDAGLEDIDALHRSRGALCCGYHYVVRKDGTVEKGRIEELVGWHTPGHNETSIGIAWIDPPGVYLPWPNTLDRLLNDIEERYPGVEVIRQDQL